MEELEERVYCSRCKGKTKHLIITNHREGSDTGEDYYWHSIYHIVKCAGCDNNSFVHQYFDEDTWDYVNGERVWKDEFRVYPEEPKVITEEEKWKNAFERLYYKAPKQFKYVPENLNNLYKQTIEAYNSKHNILCAAGLRTIIEGICNELNIKKGYIYENDGTKKLDKDNKEILTGNLAGRIFGLYEKGHILFTQALLLLKIKNIGNSAVHDIEEINIDTLRQTIDILDSILYNIYELDKHELLSD